MSGAKAWPLDHHIIRNKDDLPSFLLHECGRTEIRLYRSSDGLTHQRQFSCSLTHLLELEDRGVDFHRPVALEDVADCCEGLFSNAHLP